MTALTALTPGMHPEDSANLSSACESLDPEALNALFKLIEVAEPALLLCRDALAATRVHGDELKAIQASLDHIGELKSNRLQFPAHP